MKVVILAGGLGSRLAEETHLRPKPMIEIGGRPILWHIMKIYETHGLTDFVVCLGYKGHVIKDFFANYALYSADVTFDLGKDTIEFHQKAREPWRVTLVETGLQTLTGGRLKRVRDYVGDEDFCMTYGDGVANVDIKASIAFHRGHGRMVSLTAVQPMGRYGAIDLDGVKVKRFVEKPKGDVGWINGGFFVLSPRVLDFIQGDRSSWESHVLEQMAADDQVRAFQHQGFWQAMDTQRDKDHLESLWQSGQAAWKVWD